ncbi:MAG: hypothetical protein AMXMBFR64_11520 [Myxococcales bacterium]
MQSSPGGPHRGRARIHRAVRRGLSDDLPAHDPHGAFSRAEAFDPACIVGVRLGMADCMGWTDLMGDHDETPRSDTRLVRLAKIAPAFDAGAAVTLGNSSPLGGGGAAVIARRAASR